MANPLLLLDRVYELRVPKAGRQGTVSGYFDDSGLLHEAANELDGKVPSVYVTMNSVNPALLARAKNRLRYHAKTTTGDADILKREWILIDCDAVRPADISSTDDEHQAALDRTQSIMTWLSSQGWPEPVRADSGNGAHLLYRVDLPNDQASLHQVKAVLEVLAFRFNDTVVTIDTSVSNAARITKLYGTMACKGDSTEDRPHRRSQILHTPANLIHVPVEKLTELAKLRPVDTRSLPPPFNGARFDVRDFIQRHAISTIREKPWNGGTVHELEACPFNPEHGPGESSIIQFSSGTLGFKCFHNSCQQYHWKDLRDRFEPDRPRYAGPAAHVRPHHGVPPSDEDAPVLTQLSTIPPELVRFLWSKRIAKGKLTNLIGDPGLGKTMAALDIAARISTGAALPDGLPVEAGNVIILSAEDGAADTIRPRIDRFHGDPSRIYLLQAVKQQGKDRPFNLADDLHHLEQAVRQTQAALVLIDPLSAYLGKTDSFTDAEVRGVLGPVSALAERCDVAILGIMHLNKNSSSRALYRASGSIAFVAAARIVLLVARDPEDENRRFLTPLKTNICSPPPTLAFSIDGSGLLTWEATPVGHVDPETLLNQVDKQERRTKVDAMAWLRGFLDEGEQPASEVYAEAKKGGISERTLERAKLNLMVKQRRVGFGADGRWLWSLPHTTPVGDQWSQTPSNPLIIPKDAHTSPTAQLATNDPHHTSPNTALATNGRSLDISTTYAHTSPIDRQLDIEEVDLAR
ncbi:MAG: hypothetical protein Nkreftii_002693 [Candidatus Nitrospira kreftii]|uniref:AAA+ ATPase domain-containing protein n=1 Tax=Candidatus Nitrospira kreftii TaxID=2652173 RepID=A0A7S8J0B3_9BACT|nr:MAG: hypothetical protein Nkreftii_002693 [Candidatus Nitrospira kreftii]